MSEIFGSIRLKEKMRILVPMIALAVILATLIGVLSFCTADRHTHIYDYTLEKGENGFTLTGVCTVENCENPFYRKDDLQGVNLVSSISPTCSAAGERIYSYTVNGVTVTHVEAIEALPHTYLFEVVPGGDGYMILGQCMAEDCQDKNLAIHGVSDFEQTSVVKGDCFLPDTLTYTYVQNGETKTFTTLSLTRAPHTIGGQTTDLIANPDGSLNYGIPGLKVNSDQVFACGTVVNGYFVCEHCKLVVSTDIRYADHSFVYTEGDLTPPTREAEGCAILNCNNSGCHDTLTIAIPKIVVGENTSVVSTATEVSLEKVKYEFTNDEYGISYKTEFEVGELLKHNYHYELRPNYENTGGVDLIGRCDQPGCQTPDIYEPNVPATFKDTSTCQQKGVVTWSYVKDGQLVEFSAISPFKGPHSFVYDGNRAVHPSLYHEGFVEIHCETEGCGEIILLTLPKVVIGENTVIVGEDGENLKGEYTYFSQEYLCTVHLTVTIYPEKDGQ